MPQKTGFVYMIENPAKDYSYVGSTINWKNRQAVHKFYLKQKFGNCDGFDFTILEECPYELRKELRAKEKSWILAKKPKNNIYLV